MPLTGDISQRISKLIDEGYPYKQAVAIALASVRRRPNPKPPAKRSPQLPKRNQRSHANKAGKK
jgi:hypothetical protein